MKPRNGAVIALLLLATCNEEPRRQSRPPSNPHARHSASCQPRKSRPGRRSVRAPFRMAATCRPLRRSTKPARSSSCSAARSSIGTWARARPAKKPGSGVRRPASGPTEPAPGAAPDARSGAAMVYDSVRAKKIVLFGGRAGSGYDYEDTWEWDPG
jgi:hypothetical protein